MTMAAADQIAARVAAAVAAESPISRTLTIARAGVDLRVTSDVADSLLAPFEHLRSHQPRATALDVEIAALRDGDVDGIVDVPDSGAVIAEGNSIVHLHRDCAAVFDRAAGRIRALVRTSDGVAPWIRAKPLQVPLSIFFADRGVDLLHGALVSRDGNGLLIAGNSGSGKSTLSIAALCAGFDFLGDDCVAVDGVRGYSVFGCGCLVDGAESKSVLPIARLFADRMASSTTIRAIVLPRVTHADRVTLHPASGKEALLALAPGSILKRAVPAAGALSRMTRLARELPAFRLEMGPIAEAADAIADLLMEIAA